MTVTLAMQGIYEALVFSSVLMVGSAIWLGLSWFLQRRIDPELSQEVACYLLPSAALLCIMLSTLISILMSDFIPGTEGRQHMLLPLVGIGVAVFMVIRMFDIKWLRIEEEVARPRAPRRQP